MSKILTIMSVEEIVNQGTDYQIMTVSDTNPTNLYSDTSGIRRQYPSHLTPDRAQDTLRLVMGVG